MNKKKLQIISLVVTLICAFIPAVGVNNDGFPHIFGFPAEVYHHYEPFIFNFQGLGFILISFSSILFFAC
ncbi:hypothetical protein JOC77_004219 [Peribacillus deserti]|uniref:DUF3955 domain-containing protein n=1 Tax=Peribacillus deserti TaxID=673318 RepID=A0ABS2QNI9_9BACI|nr:hypothetical protein [Peribacillus deserti]MBM7694742.1 hypothetical protein [Peribacillus deserti]